MMVGSGSTARVYTPVRVLTNDTTTGGTGWTDTNVLSYYQVINQKQRVWNSWTTSSSSVTMNEWPTGWLDTGTCGSTTNTISFTTSGVTSAAEQVWRLPAWQNSKHSEVRWTPTVHRNPKTPEQLAQEAAERERRRQEQIRLNARKNRFKEAAKSRARDLLMSLLNDDQRQEMEEKNHFHLTVHSRDGSMKVYRIEYGFQGNVKLLGPDGQPTRRYCIHSDSRLPYEDQMLAQKLLLESNEEEFLRIANMTRLRAA